MNRNNEMTGEGEKKPATMFSPGTFRAKEFEVRAPHTHSLKTPWAALGNRQTPCKNIVAGFFSVPPVVAHWSVYVPR